MLLKTHLAIIALFILFYITNVTHKLTFVLVVLIATIIPDMDTANSLIGKSKPLMLFQFFTKHRGFFHSFTFCIIITLILVYYSPIVALPFFMGYGVHIFFDSFTVQGITPFWPWQKKSSGKIRTGGLIEKNIFWVLVLLDILVLALVII